MRRPARVGLHAVETEQERTSHFRWVDASRLPPQTPDIITRRIDCPQGDGNVTLTKLLLASSLVLATLGSPELANAQGRGYRNPPQRQPTVSPYLNLLRPGGAAQNYYGVVRPELEFRQNLNRQTRDINDLQRGLTATQEQTSALTTGHRSHFLNYGGYFPGLGGQGSGAAGQSLSARSFGAPRTSGVSTSGVSASRFRSY
jgi:hypothetical protein